MELATIIDNVRAISGQFAQQRSERQLRRDLDPSDFDLLREAGFLLTGVLAEQGGLWQNISASTRPICELLRVLAHGDSSVALVSAMHPAVLAFWLGTPQAAAPFEAAWTEQRNWCSQSAREGHWWGTITSEPGSGGDISRTKAMARPDGVGDGYRLSGHKHFGSGSGVTSFMITTAMPEGESEPDLFFLDMRGKLWDGSAGVKLTAPWDGHGMAATQSHAMQFENFPAARSAWLGSLPTTREPVGLLGSCCFTAVIVGIVEAAGESARQSLQKRYASLRAYEQVEWSRAEMEAWLVQQAYEGMLRAVEQKGLAARHDVTIGKTTIAELAEACLGRLCRVVGGGTYSRRSPLGFWFEDVRALGFLRPPWALAFDQVFAELAPAE